MRFSKLRFKEKLGIFNPANWFDVAGRDSWVDLFIGSFLALFVWFLCCTIFLPVIVILVLLDSFEEDLK